MIRLSRSYDIVQMGEEMARASKSSQDTSLMAAALEGLELQKQRIEEQIRQVRAILGRRRPKPAGKGGATAARPARRRQMSARARKRIAVAQKRRWAEYRKKMAAGKTG